VGQPIYYVIQQGPANGEGDSEVAKPDKFTGRKPRKICSFIASCIAVFDNKPRKFMIKGQRVSYAALFLSDITQMWWQPFLVAGPEPPIRSSWEEFVAELNRYFGDPDLAQSSERALRGLKMQEHHCVNKYLIEFMEHATYTGWNDRALYGEFYRGLAERLKDQLLNLPKAFLLKELKTQALKCDDHYWERQHERGPSTSTAKAKITPSSTTTSRSLSQPRNETSSSTAPIAPAD
jgi:hypothetical protein